MNRGRRDGENRKTDKLEGDKGREREDEKGTSRVKKEEQETEIERGRKKGAPFCAICPNVGANFPRYTQKRSTF